MEEKDLKRELVKILEAVSLAEEYHTKINEANSKLHCSSTVLYSPMTTKLILAKKSLERIINEKS